LYTSIPTDSNNSDPPVKCIPLHGTVEELKCSDCSSVYKLEAYFSDLEDGRFPECSQCSEEMSIRARSNKRNRKKKVPRLRSNIILYDEEHPQGEDIANAENSDICQGDFLLVVGTSLKIPGTQTFVRKFAKILHDNSTTKSTKNSKKLPQVIYLNDCFTNQSAWKSTFDGWVEADCEEFARTGLKKLEKEWSDKTLDDGTEAKGSLYGDRRLDSRPSWVAFPFK
jgi:NAD-dependent SIR2 family protein deacetylase